MTSTTRDYIESLPVYEMPKKYGWRYNDALSVEDIGFPYVSDCLHKKYTNESENFPPEFDTSLLYRLFYRRAKTKTRYGFIDIDPKRIIMGQRYIGKGRLLQILEDSNPEPIVMSKIGDFHINRNGHHRLCLNFIRKRRAYVKCDHFIMP